MLCGRFLYFLIILPSYLKIVSKEGLLNVGEHVVRKLVIFHADNDIIKKIIFVLGQTNDDPDLRTCINTENKFCSTE